MSQKIESIPFGSGEISPQLIGRTDLSSYRLGLAMARNFFVDYRGGISTRPGTEFCDYVGTDDTGATKFVPFRFAPNLSDTYMILFMNDKVRFLQDGAYVLEASTTITAITAADPGVVTAASHGLANGDMVKLASIGGMTELNGIGTALVANKTTNTFELQDVFGSNLDTSGFTTYTTGGTVSRVYTVTSPYGEEELVNLKARQIRDYVRLTHPSYPVKNLVRTSATSWAFSNDNFDAVDFGPGSAPAVTVQSQSGGTTSGDAEAIYAITAVDKDGQESLPSPLLLKTGMAAYLDDEDLSAKISWSVVTGAKYYKVFRSRVVNYAGAMTKGDALGLIAETFATKITDTDLIPDFTEQPPTASNPFAPGAVLQVDVTAGGSGYTSASAISVSGGGGAGFRGELIVYGGAVVGVKIIDPGSGYSGATASATVGSSATFTVTVRGATGTYPSVSVLHQQRQVYAGSNNDPLGIWASRVGRFSNYSVTESLTDEEACEYELEADVLAPIRALVSDRIGLIVFARDGIWLATGGSEQSITPTNILAESHPTAGAADVYPLRIDRYNLYVDNSYRTIRLLSFEDGSRQFGGRDVSFLSNHLFKDTNKLLSWTYAEAPYHLVWAVQADGTLLSFTVSPETETLAWTVHDTDGLFTDIESVEEGNSFGVYAVVKRYVNGRWSKFIERMAVREFDNVEDAWAVDAGLKTTSTYPAAILTPGASTGTGITFTASASVFASGDVGKVIRAGGGLGTVASYVSGTEITVTLTRDITSVLAESGTPIPIASGDWTMDATFTTVSGLDHLEGETVSVLLDGKVLADKTVTGGVVTLGATGSRAIVGRGFTAKARTLPVFGEFNTSISDRYKRVVGSSIRLHETAGLKSGDTLANLYEMDERISDNLGTAVELSTDINYVTVGHTWDKNGQVYYVQDFPLPATILGLVVEMEIGSDSD